MPQIESNPRERDCRMIPPIRTHRLMIPTSCSKPDREAGCGGGKKRTICPMARPAVIKLRRTKMGQVTFDSLKAPLDRFLLPYYVVFWRAGACCRYRGGVRQCLYLRHG